MPVTPTYPGIYIEEIPSSSHTITAAPTSIAVFIGYAHPFKTNPNNWGKAVQIFSFTDYQRGFGGFILSDVFDQEEGAFGDLALAVYQFFLNGGSVAYVVALNPMPSGGLSPPEDVNQPQVTVGGITFTAIEPVDADHPLSVSVTVPQTSPPTPATVADITVTYGSGPGSRVETYRKVSINPADLDPKSSNYANHIVRRIGTLAGLNKPANFVSTLVAVSPDVTTLPATVSTGSNNMPPWPSAGATIFRVSDFGPVFATDSSLDKVPIFNLMYLPGVVDNGVLSEAVAFCEAKEAFLIMDCLVTDGVDPSDSTHTYVGDYIGAVPHSKNAALYFPYLQSEHPVTGASISIPPGGTVVGIFSLIDQNRGVWKALPGWRRS